MFENMCFAQKVFLSMGGGLRGWGVRGDSQFEDLWETKVERLDELDSKVKLNFFSSPSSKSQSPKSQSQDQQDSHYSYGSSSSQNV